MNNPKFQKWQRAAQVIENQLIELLGARVIFEDYGNLVTQNQKIARLASVFHDWIKANYATFVAMSIRRQALHGKDDEITLYKLIQDIGHNAGAVTYKMHRALYKDMDTNVADSIARSTFVHCAGWESDNFNKKIAEADLKNLTAVSRNITDLVDWKIAHTTKKTAPKLTFDEVNHCIDNFKEVSERYILLLTAHNIDLRPVVDDRWVEAFREKWILN